jgi:hypothetical protein
MPEAVVTLKCNPTDFDLIRLACKQFKDNQMAVANDNKVDAKTRSEARAESTLMKLILDRMA